MTTVCLGLLACDSGIVYFFFFSSRRRHTRLQGDWSSDVCSSDLYPLYMTFFSTPEKLEIGVPFVTAGDKPTRREALAYYRRVAEHFELDVRQYHAVARVERRPDGFELVARHPGAAEPETIRSRHVVCATGGVESPNLLGVPGE